jgi:hypothetical protein
MFSKDELIEMIMKERGFCCEKAKYTLHKMVADGVVRFFPANQPSDQYVFQQLIDDGTYVEQIHWVNTINRVVIGAIVLGSLWALSRWLF